jgi:hypothetical protein
VAAVIGFQPTEEQALVLETVHGFAEKELRPLARECDESRSIPRALLERAVELGLVANALPTQHGGGGERSALTGVLVAEELAWGDLSLALAILCPALAALPLADFGDEAQQREWLPRYAGDAFLPGSLAVVEPRFGADAFRPETTARRAGSEWVLAGRKCLVPWLEGGGALLVSARDEDGAGCLFLVPRDARGLDATPERNLGIQALPTAELALEGVRVPDAARLAAADLPRLVARGRVALAATGVGVARAAFEIARDYAKERHAFGAPIATKQAIAFKLADMAIEIDGARLLVWRAAWRLDQGGDALREATLAYQQVRRVALQACDGAVQVLGGHGYTREYLPELHLRNARGYAAFEALALV